MVRLDNAQRELRASPLNPKVLTHSRSSKLRSFEVQCLRPLRVVCEREQRTDNG